MAKLSGGRRSSWNVSGGGWVEVPEGMGRLERGDGWVRGREEAVVLVDIGIGFNKPDAGASFGSDGEWPLLILDDTEPADDRVEVKGMAKLPLGLCARETASESDAGDPLR